jgi:hypothetical protein
MNRLIELDILRGFLLLLMVVNHAPTRLRLLTDQPIGFFSTAEAFVFVSAFLAGLLFQKRSDKHGFRAARSATVSRALRIYRAHIYTLIFAFMVCGIFLSEVPGIQNLLDQYFKNPLAAIPASLALVFQPPLMDILPMYVLFSLLTPCAFWAAKRWGWKSVFYVSVGLWAFSQFRFRDMLIVALKDVSFVDFGPFDLFSWQLLWIGGLIFGKSLQAREPVIRLSRRSELLLLILAIGFLCLRWYTIVAQIDPGKQLWVLDKWHLGPLRVMNFFAVAWFVSKILPMLQRWKTALRPLQLVGQNMLPIFSCEICLSLLLAGTIDPHKSSKPWATALVLTQVLSIFLLAWYLDKRTRRDEPISQVI